MKIQMVRAIIALKKSTLEESTTNQEDVANCIVETYRFNKWGQTTSYDMRRLGSYHRYKYDRAGKLLQAAWVNKDASIKPVTEIYWRIGQSGAPDTYWKASTNPATLRRVIFDPCFSIDGEYEFRFVYDHRGLVQSAQGTLIKPGKEIRNPPDELFVRWEYSR